MLYRVALTIPANTPATSPVEAELVLPEGVSTRRDVVFPDGCHLEAHVQVWDAGWQIMPWNRHEWLAADGETVVDASAYSVAGPECLFTLFGYNEDTVNDHTITLRVQMAEGAIPAGLARFVDLLKRIGVI